MKKLLVLLLSSAGLLYSCGPSMVDLAIDNPSQHPIIVTIDELVVEVPGRQVAWVEMGKGAHQITLENDTVFTYNFSSNLYFLNATRSEYLKTEAVYGNQLFQTNALPNKKIVFLGMEIEGNYDVLTELITPITWHYGPREKLPEVVELDEDEPYAAFVKLSDQLEILEQISASSENYE